MTAKVLNSKEADPENYLRQINQKPEQTEGIKIGLLSFIICVFLMLGPQYLPHRIVFFSLGVLPAFYFTWLLRWCPSSLQTRNGSLATAMGLVMFLWMIAFFTILVSFLVLSDTLFAFNANRFCVSVYYRML